MLAAASSIDLLVTDIALGDGPDGWQVARRARARSPDMPVIYMTGGRGDEWRPQHVPMGVLLLKPFPIDQLVDMAGRLLAAQAETAGQKSA
jgi:DNA-binding response OmpR family regulator